MLIKRWPSAFPARRSARCSTARGVDTVIVCGCTTSGCIRATDHRRVLGAAIACSCPTDAVGDHDQEPHDANLLDCARRYCDLTTVDDAIGYLRRRAAA